MGGPRGTLPCRTCLRSLVRCLPCEHRLLTGPPPRAAPPLPRSAKTDANGVPQATTCQVTVALGGQPLTFTATAYQGDPSSPRDEDLRSEESDPFT